MHGSDSWFGPIPMGRTHTNNPIYDAGADSVYSVDNIRLRMSYDKHRFSELSSRLDIWMGLEHTTYYTGGNRVGCYRYMWAYGYDLENGEHGTIAVGCGLVGSSGAVDEGIGFVEYNPNKVGGKGRELLSRLEGFGCVLEPVRFDLAIDFPVKRDGLRMVKDKRKYGCELSNGLTEYLGQRNQPGRVKVYDKAAQLKLDCAWTRVELTCDASWDAEKVCEKLPVVFDYDSIDFQKLKGITKAFCVSLQAHLAKGDVIEPWLRMVDPKTRSKIRKWFKEGESLSYAMACISMIVARVGNWQETSKIYL